MCGCSRVEPRHEQVGSGKDISPAHLTLTACFPPPPLSPHLVTSSLPCARLSPLQARPRTGGILRQPQDWRARR